MGISGNLAIRANETIKMFAEKQGNEKGYEYLLCLLKTPDFPDNIGTSEGVTQFSLVCAEIHPESKKYHYVHVSDTDSLYLAEMLDHALQKNQYEIGTWCYLYISKEN